MLRAGIIGMGVGEAHIAGYNSHPNCEVTAICDFQESVLAEKRQTYPTLKATTKAEEILDDPDIDVVTIASYDSFHHEQIIRAINNGKHIFVEKPLCLYEEEAQDIFEHLQKHPELRISSNLILRMAERFIQLRAQVTEGLFGDIFHINGAYNYGRLHKITEGWRGKEKFYSAVYGGGVHLIDLYLWLLQEPVKEVFAFGNDIASRKSPFSNFDLVTSVLQFESGITANMTVNLGCLHPHFHPLEIYGTKATFQNGLNSATLYRNRETMEPETISTAYPGAQKGDLLYDFIDSIQGQREPNVSSSDIFDAMVVCFAIERSAHSGKPEPVKYYR